MTRAQRTVSAAMKRLASSGVLHSGFAPAAVPLPTILPVGVAGCSLLATPDLVAAMVPIGGVVPSSLSIPNAPGLAGVLIHHQVLPLEFSPAGGLIALTGGNGLQLTLGGY